MHMRLGEAQFLQLGWRWPVGLPNYPSIRFRSTRCFHLAQRSLSPLVLSEPGRFAHFHLRSWPHLSGCKTELDAALGHASGSDV